MRFRALRCLCTLPQAQFEREPWVLGCHVLPSELEAANTQPRLDRRCPPLRSRAQKTTLPHDRPRDGKQRQQDADVARCEQHLHHARTAAL